MKIKQRIDASQLAELSPEQQEGLRGWWKPDKFDIVYWQKEDKEDTYSMCLWQGASKEDLLPLLNIGQCIEILEGRLFSITPPWGSYNKLDIWSIWVDGQGYGERGDELVDVLWQAVKTVL